MNREKLNRYVDAKSTVIMAKRKGKLCIECGWMFQPHLIAQKTCNECSPENKKKRSGLK